MTVEIAAEIVVATCGMEVSALHVNVLFNAPSQLVASLLAVPHL